MAAAAMFIVMFASFMAQILSRYVFNAPLSWTLEICSIAYIWVIFWSCDILVSERQHIIFDVLYQKFPPAPRRAVAIANTAAVGFIFLAALPGTLDYIAFLGRRHTMVLHLPFDIVYSCFGIFMIAAIVGAAIRLRRLLSSSWKTHL
ncbi:TRAP transporter small permease subunit [Nordella sp. HKS 07]|uniref:TRAP transporter small permease n=1 Tax=Nordella sp. HKS 07 TaxID=2712222 RepID=UPI0013E12E2B|nr:TRAP transporter small permease subunit [Nordella sp. HKS 07]QIG48874.1 TRAP transporter small permease subunit [Nordella sp. HKS 07]